MLTVQKKKMMMMITVVLSEMIMVMMCAGAGFGLTWTVSSNKPHRV